jgi:hypothetical protein
MNSDRLAFGSLYRISVNTPLGTSVPPRPPC